jgi:hypothetical protein
MDIISSRDECKYLKTERFLNAEFEILIVAFGVKIAYPQTTWNTTHEYP